MTTSRRAYTGTSHPSFLEKNLKTSFNSLTELDIYYKEIFTKISILPPNEANTKLEEYIREYGKKYTGDQIKNAKKYLTGDVVTDLGKFSPELLEFTLLLWMEAVGTIERLSSEYNNVGAPGSTLGKIWNVIKDKKEKAKEGNGKILTNEEEEIYRIICKIGYYSLAKRDNGETIGVIPGSIATNVLNKMNLEGEGNSVRRRVDILIPKK